MDITKPSIETRVSDYGFDIFCLSPVGQLTFSGDFSPKIKAHVSPNLIANLPVPVDNLIPFVVACLPNGDVTVEVPSGDIFFEQDFTALNKVMFQRETPDFIFE